MKKNYFYNLLLSVTNIIFPVISFPYAARILGPVGIGKVQMASSFALYFALFAALGIPIYGMQEVAKFRHNRKELDTVFSELVITNFIAGLVFSIVYIVVIFSFPYFAPNIAIYLYAGLIILLSFSYIDWFYSGMEEFKPIALRSFVIKALALVLLFVLVKKPEDYTWYLLITVFSLVCNNLVSFILITGKTRLVFIQLNLKKHLTPLFYILSTTIAASMYTILDTVLLGFLADEKAAGLYTSAAKITRITLPFITAIGVISVPKIAKAVSENRFADTQELLDTSFHYIIFLAVPVFAGLYLLAPECILVFSGKQFLDATLTMQLLSLLPLLIGFGYFFAFQILVPGGKNKEMFLSVSAGLVCFIVLCFVLVPFLYDTGTAIANICSELLVTCLYFYFVKKYFTYTYPWRLLFNAVKSSIIFIPWVLLVRGLHLNAWLTLGVSGILCSASYFLVQYFIFKDAFVFKVFDLILKTVSFKKIEDDVV